MFNKKINTNAPIHELISARWSGRAYDPNRMLSRQQIISLLEAARWAPSCYGYQPWRYIVCDKASNESSWSKALECLAEGNQVWAKNASVLPNVFNIESAFVNANPKQFFSAALNPK